MQVNELVSPRIAIVKLSSLGDVIHALPVLCGLKKQWPNSQISWLVEAASKDLLDRHKDLSEVIVVDTKTWRKEIKNLSKHKDIWRDIYRGRQELKERKFDLALDLQGLIKSAIVTRAADAKASIGFHPRFCREPISGLFYSHWVKPEPEVHVIDKNLSFLKYLGLDSQNVQFNLQALPREKNWAKEWLAQKIYADGKTSHPLVIIHPGTRWQSKRWPKENYIKLISLLQERDIKLLLSGGPEEKGLLNEINAGLSKKVVTAVGLTLKNLIALIESCDLMIASDTGPLHLAVALGKETISFYGPTPFGPNRNGPYGKGHTIFYPEVSCRACGLRYCEDLKCMRAIMVQDVFAAAVKHLEKGNKSL